MAVMRTWSHESIVDSCLFQPVYIFSKKTVLAMGKCPLLFLEVGLGWLTERGPNELQAIIICSSSGYGHVIWWDTGRSFLELRGKTRVHASAGMVCQWEAWNCWSHLATTDGRHENDSGNHRGESKTTAILSRLNGGMERRLDPFCSVDQSLPEACALLRNVKESPLIHNSLWRWILNRESNCLLCKLWILFPQCLREWESNPSVCRFCLPTLTMASLCAIPTMKY